jgi:transcriptional regulator with XRE-family HTH domain
MKRSLTPSPSSKPSGEALTRTSPQRDLLGDRLKKLRKQRGWTLADASQRTGLSVATLSKVENNKISLGYDSLVKLGSGYGIDLSQLLAPQPVLPAGADWAVSIRDEMQKHETPFYIQQYPFAASADDSDLHAH